LILYTLGVNTLYITAKQMEGSDPLPDCWYQHAACSVEQRLAIPIVRVSVTLQNLRLFAMLIQ
jgi:hypothetical protein